MTNKLRVVVTRPKNQNSNLIHSLAEAGFSIIEFPTTKIEFMEVSASSVSADWIVFSSKNGVIGAKNSGIALDKVKVAVQGESSREIIRRDYSRGVDLFVSGTSYELGEALLSNLQKDDKVVFLGAERRSGHLERAFAEGGREIEIVPIYRTVAESPPSEELLGELNLGGEGLVFTFYSPSSFLSALELLGDRESLLREGRIYSLGPITTDAIRSQGYEVFAESKIQSDKGVIELLRDTSNLVYSSKSK